METTSKEYTLGRWSLDDLFPGHESKEMQAALKQLEASVAAFEKNRSKLKPKSSDKIFLSILKQMEENTRVAARIAQFSELSPIQPHFLPH